MTTTAYTDLQWTTETTVPYTYTASYDHEECLASDLDLDSIGQPGRSALAVVITLMAGIIAFGSVGNLLVIAAVLRQKQLRTTSNAFVVNLSVCDLIFVTTVLPFNVYTYLYHDRHLEAGLCSFVGFIGYTLTGTTILTITLIAWNRYKVVVDMSNYKQIFNTHNLVIMLIFTWVIPAISLLGAVFKQWGHFGYVSQLSSCNLAMDNTSQGFKIFLLVIRAAVPSCLIIYFYAAIYATTHASRKRLRNDTSRGGDPKDALNQHNMRREMRLTRMMASIFVVFALSYFPCTISSVIDWNRMLSKTFHLFCQTSVFLGSAINPLLYGFMNQRFREAYYQIITCDLFKRRRDMIMIAATTGNPAQTPSIRHKPTMMDRKSLHASPRSNDVRVTMTFSIVKTSC